MKKHKYLIVTLLLLLPFFITKNNLALVTIGGNVEMENRIVSILSVILWGTAFAILTKTSENRKQTAAHISIVLCGIALALIISGIFGGILTIFWWPFAGLTEYITIFSIVSVTAAFIAVPWIIVLLDRKR